jgi:hypothetical protein
MSVCKRCGSDIKRKGVNHDGSRHAPMCHSLRARKARGTPAVTNSIYTKFYDDPNVPPWDESLGEFQPC